MVFALVGDSTITRSCLRDPSPVAAARLFLAGSAVSPFLAFGEAAFLRPVARGVPASDACFLCAGTEVSLLLCCAADSGVRPAFQPDILTRMSGWKAGRTPESAHVSCCCCVVPRTRYNHHFERGPP